MYTETTEGFNSIISGSSRHFYCKLSRDGEELTTGFFNVKITQQANPETDSFTIGGTVATVVEVEMKKPNSMLTGKEFQLSFGLEVDGEVEWCPMCVVTAEKPKEDSGLITFTAYDRMVTALNYPYYTDITSYPVDAKVILREISTKSGISIANLDSLPDGIYVHQIAVENEDTGTYTAKNPFAGCTYREAVKYLAQLYGTFATMNRTGELEFRWYTSTGYTIELNRSMDDVVLNEEEYEVQRIICAAGKAAIPGTDMGFVLLKFRSPVSSDEDGILSVGKGTIGITMENPVMDVTIMEKLWKKIGGFKFTPTTVSFLGDCRLDLGDIVTVKTRDGSLELPIMGIDFEFDGGLSTEIGSYGSTEMQEASAFTGNSDKIVDYVNSEILRVNELLANKVNTNYLEANYATIKNLDAVNARIDSITSTDITVEYLEAHYAQIDMENVDTAVIRQGFLENLMVSQGIIADRVVGTEVVATDVLTGVNIYADDITAGTLSVDRLVLRGTEKSLVYALNNSGELVSTQVDTLDAYILTERTVTADKIVAESITANEIASSAITAEKIATNAVTAAKIEAGAITSVKIKAGAVTADKITVDSLEAIVAKIGGFTINSKAIYKGTNSKASTTAGIYLGTDAVRAYASADAYTHIENGVLTCVGASIKGDIHCDGSLYLYSFGYARDWEVISTSFSTDDPQLHIKDVDGIDILIWTEQSGLIIREFKTSRVYASNWFGSIGETGWYNETYGGGWYMKDANWIRNYGSKKVYLDNVLRVDSNIQFGSSGSYFVTSTGVANVNNIYVLGGSIFTGSDATVARIRGGALVVTNTDANAYVAVHGSQFVVNSSKLVKENIESITEDEAKKLLQLRPVFFDYKENFGGQKNNTGLIAEEVKSVLPNLVYVPEDYDETLFDEVKGINQPILSLDYSKFVPYLIKMVQMQQEEINQLKQQLYTYN